ncbi:polymerase delta-interacting protein 3 [Parelaphostrongylus tenuis]|uniref:Polymerase delta-interacting protein 3 n=1 Tax=Parelaphostrongylus tenuis TaxID=148309 RepID=A0AAD5R2U5_PARTN|nr:polymerase delta-interacting protein 3 [Parelaphostrongylus tenuis]
MSLINMSLEEIIGKNKKSKSGRLVGGFRSDVVHKTSTKIDSGTRSFGRFSDRTPAGKWKHDKFQDDSRTVRVRGGAIAKVVAGSSNPNKKVRVNLSNLGPNVVSADLEELFAAYNIDSATVHFNESGVSLGTGDVFLRRKDALQMFEDFKGVSLDGKLIKMLIVDGGEGVANGIESRLSKLPRQRGIQKKFKRSPTRVPTSFLDRILDDKPRRGLRMGRGFGRRDRKPQKSVAELDAELDSYMKKGRPMDL